MDSTGKQCQEWSHMRRIEVGGWVVWPISPCYSLWTWGFFHKNDDFHERYVYIDWMKASFISGWCFPINQITRRNIWFLIMTKRNQFFFFFLIFDLKGVAHAQEFKLKQVIQQILYIQDKLSEHYGDYN